MSADPRTPKRGAMLRRDGADRSGDDAGHRSARPDVGAWNVATLAQEGAGRLSPLGVASSDGARHWADDALASVERKPAEHGVIRHGADVSGLLPALGRQPEEREPRFLREILRIVVVELGQAVREARHVRVMLHMERVEGGLHQTDPRVEERGVQLVTGTLRVAARELGIASEERDVAWGADVGKSRGVQFE